VQPGWGAAILSQRQEVEDLLADNPSLRSGLPEFVAAGYESRTEALRTGLLDLQEEPPFTIEQAFGEALPDA